MNKSLVGILGLLIGGASAAAGFYSGQLSQLPAEVAAEPTVIEAPAAAPATAEIEKTIRNYLRQNPEIMLEVQTAYEAKRTEQERALQVSALKDSKAAIFESPDDAILGNPKGDVTVVEFFDYNCGYCRRAVGDMQQLIEKDPNVRFVLKELPILGPDSVKAHIVAQAFKKLMPEKYNEFHLALMGAGHADEDSAIALAKSLGADEATLRTGMDAPEIGKHFEENTNIAQKLAINGTPAYAIVDTIIPGALGFDALAEKVANVRKCQSATC
jgi:protein-disulfide isomerase